MIQLLLKFLIHFFSLIILKACIFKWSVLFGTHTLLDKSLTVLQLPKHLRNLIADGELSVVIFDSIL